MSIKTLKAGSPVKLDKLVKNEHKTQPPPRFSETKLISELEKRGIGRPATFSSIVSVIQERGYVKKVKGQQLAPTFLGFTVARLLMEKFPEFTAYEYTSQMEEALEAVEEGRLTREKFLANFWNGPKGFAQLIKDLSSNIDWAEIRELSTLDLGNGYSIVYNKFGAFLQDNAGTPDEKGYLPSVKIDEESLAEEYLDAEVCKKLFESSAKHMEERELGKLEDGEYKGWIVTARSGKFGPFLQAISPGAGVKKPVNHSLPEGMDLATVTLDDVKDLFAEVKLPRTISDNYFTGIGKRGPWLGWKASARAKKAKFKSLPEGVDPRTLTLEEAEKIWKGE